MFKIGNKELVGMLLGSIPVYKIMLGSAEVYKNFVEYKDRYLTFDVISGGEIYWKKIGSVAKTISYSLDRGDTWTEITASSSTVINVNAGDKVLFKGLNSNYAIDKNNYSGFDGGTATYNIEGNIMSLIYGDNFINNDTLTDSFTFCSLFKLSNVISAKNLILPASTLTTACYRALFSKAMSLIEAPQLPATTLAESCYWYMFETCPMEKAPDLLSTTLVKECYGHMFEGCSNLNYIRCLATSISASNCTVDWVKTVSATGTFIKDKDTSWGNGTSKIPNDWLVVDLGAPAAPAISFDGYDTIEITCETQGATIYYRLGQSGSFHTYSAPIVISDDTTIEAYTLFDDLNSLTQTQSCIYVVDIPLLSSNRVLNTWAYNGQSITTPYSINRIDGHSGNYSKGSFNFTTTFGLRRAQPTYLWFLHADQTAAVYIDDVLVLKHWGGYNAFFVDLTNSVHKGTNNLKVTLKNNEGNVLAPYAGDFNFNATLGNVKLFSSPVLPDMQYGYDGFHVTSSVTNEEAAIYVRTNIPSGASVVCSISGTNCNYTETKNSTGNELTFTTTITNPRLWNGTIDPYLYTITLSIYYNNELYHLYTRGYGLRYFEYLINDTEKVGTSQNPYTGFLLNGSPYLLRGVCMHDDFVNRANALTDADYTLEFSIITELGCNFIRLAHYPHPKEVYDKCDQLGIIVQTEVPWVNKSTTSETEDYWTHLEDQCEDMVNQHYNHPCILFWGVGNEINTSYTSTEEGKDFIKGKIEGYRTIIRNLLPGAWVGYTVSHSTDKGLLIFNYPTVDWLGSNIYVGWYVNKTSNNPSSYLNSRIAHTLELNIPTAFSEYGCGGTQHCHSEDFTNTTTTGNNPRHDIEYLMWLHEGHLAAIRNYPQLLFTALWLLFDIAVSNRLEGYKICHDGVTELEDSSLKYLNNKGLVERDHVTKKDTFYLYKAEWSSLTFVHICGKDYAKLQDRVIKCYTNDGSSLSMYVNNVFVETVNVDNHIALFTAIDFTAGDVVRVEGTDAHDTYIITLYEYVDLGLPSGTLWATKNVGAFNTKSAGDYFLYGKGASVYNDTYQDNYYEGVTSPLDNTLDTATLVWGSPWHMPTYTLMLELLNNTTYEYTVIDTVYGGKFTAPNGNYIFLPAAGYKYSGTGYQFGDGGNYLSSDNPGYFDSSRALTFYGQNTCKTGNEYRYYGLSVRPVIG